MRINFGMFFLICIIVISVMAILCLVRAIIGPKLADRIMAVNMIGTLTIAIIILLSVLLNESMMLDVALVYAVISFVAVMVLTQIYIGIYREKRQLGQKEGEKDED
ncbi:monovalent cation/H+ antiporter complex subunit F [Butyrivibrio sp. AE2032]|uniref:monovalent cation/H+ antiporter complex subunit F n=1 Tax=Butyrivibrio sp. AE2032 TaxID=1458463 RepID=UPI001FA6C473|nr:monovalent cation/H+ antiporter complex subunit F [Butyrivibrio sp. AE2032]